MNSSSNCLSRGVSHGHVLRSFGLTLGGFLGLACFGSLFAFGALDGKGCSYVNDRRVGKLDPHDLAAVRAIKRKLVGDTMVSEQEFILTG